MPVVVNELEVVPPDTGQAPQAGAPPQAAPAAPSPAAVEWWMRERAERGERRRAW